VIHVIERRRLILQEGPQDAFAQLADVRTDAESVFRSSFENLLGVINRESSPICKHVYEGG
jgi:hypothetical protein